MGIFFSIFKILVFFYMVKKRGQGSGASPPPKQQPPRGARRYAVFVRKLSVANAAGRRRALICPTSVAHSTSPYVVHEQRSVGGSPT